MCNERKGISFSNVFRRLYLKHLSTLSLSEKCFDKIEFFCYGIRTRICGKIFYSNKERLCRLSVRFNKILVYVP